MSGGGGDIGPKTLVGAVAGGPVGAAIGMNLDSGDQAADAATKAARAQQGAANDWINYTQLQMDQALNDVKDLTPSQLASFEKSLQMQEANVRRSERLVDAIDPALLEAGKQATELLQGKEASVLGPMKNQRQMQRQQLIDTLRQQMGPGAETSQAGLNALAKFDAETSTQLGNAQATYTNMLLNTSLSAKPNLAGEIGAYNTLGQSLVNAQQTPGLQRAQIRGQFNGLMSGAQQAKVGAAGGEFSGDMLRARQGMQLSSALLQGGMSLAGGMMTGGASTAASAGAGAGAGSTLGGSIVNPTQAFGMYA